MSYSCANHWPAGEDEEQYRKRMKRQEQEARRCCGSIGMGDRFWAGEASKLHGDFPDMELISRGYSEAAKWFLACWNLVTYCSATFLDQVLVWGNGFPYTTPWSAVWLPKCLPPLVPNWPPWITWRNEDPTAPNGPCRCAQRSRSVYPHEITIWLVVWNMNSMFPHIGNFIIPTDFHIFQRGGLKTTNQQSALIEISAELEKHASQSKVDHPHKCSISGLPPKLYSQDYPHSALVPMSIFPVLLDSIPCFTLPLWSHNFSWSSNCFMKGINDILYHNICVYNLMGVINQLITGGVSTLPCGIRWLIFWRQMAPYLIGIVLFIAVAVAAVLMWSGCSDRAGAGKVSDHRWTVR